MKDLNYWKNNCEEDYLMTPISVLRYITKLEEKVEEAINYKRCCTELRKNNKPIDGGTSYATLGQTKEKSDM